MRLCLRRHLKKTRMLSTWEEGSGVEHDDVVEVGGNACRAFDALVNDLNEPPGRGTAA